MHKHATQFALVAMLFALLIAPAQALNDRSWVASTGGGSICSRSSPCATFATALAATNAGGEINCVDQGDFLALTIGKAITIDCAGVQGRVGYAVGGSTAIYVDVPATDVVVLRGLDIFGTGVTGAGIAYVSGAALHVEKCVIRNFAYNSNGFNEGWGIVASPLVANTISELFVSDTQLIDNGASSGAGISLQPNASNVTLRATLDRVEARNNYFGIKVDGTGAGNSISGGVINVTVRDSVSSGNRSNGIVATGTTGGPAIIMMVERSTSSQNATAGFGVIADGPNTTITLTGSTVMGNVNGIGASNGGSLISYRNNNVTSNSTDGSPTSVISPK